MNKVIKSVKLIIETKMTKESEFFKGKRPWSRIKDQILTNYLTPYISKVAKLNKRIVIVDAFAGSGKFDDESIGSPLIICNNAERIVPNKYLAIFLNSDKDSYQDVALCKESIEVWEKLGMDWKNILFSSAWDLERQGYISIYALL